MERQTVKTTFYLSEFYEEEKWLECQHKSGWKFIKTDGKTYEFEKCPKEDWVYQLDFKASDVAEKDYLQIFEDYGWEFVQRHRHWFYFRKKRTDDDGDYSIFSDAESKIEMCRRVIRGRLFRNILLPLVLLTVAYFGASVFVDSRLWKPWLRSVAMFGLSIGITYVMVHYGNQYKRVKKKIGRLKRHLE